MFYKAKKVTNLTGVIQADLFRYYQKIRFSENHFLSQQKVQQWLIFFAFGSLGFALMRTTLIVYLYVVIWFFQAIQSKSPSIIIPPVSLQYWIYSISILTSLYSINLFFTFFREFRLILLVEYGMTIKQFLQKRADLRVQKMQSLLFGLLCFFICWYPQVGLFLLWSLPLLCEYYCLSSLIFNHTLTLDKWRQPQTETSFFELLSLEYLNFKENLGEEDDSETLLTGKEDFNEPATVRWYTMADTQETYMAALYCLPEETFSNFSLDEDLSSEDIDDAALVFHPIVFWGDLTIFDTPLKKNILKLRFEAKQPFLFFDEQNQFTRLTCYTKKSVSPFLSSQSKYSPTMSTYDNDFFTNDYLIREYEALSDYFAEQSNDDADERFFDAAGEADQYADMQTELSNYYIFYGPNNLELQSQERGFGDEYSAPNWFLVSFCYTTLFFWCLLNIGLCICLVSFGIPESWLYSVRGDVAVFVQKSYLDLFLLHLELVNILTSEWAAAELPYCQFSRRDFFQNMLFPFTFVEETVEPTLDIEALKIVMGRFEKEWDFDTEALRRHIRNFFRLFTDILVELGLYKPKVISNKVPTETPDISHFSHHYAKQIREIPKFPVQQPNESEDLVSIESSDGVLEKTLFNGAATPEEEKPVITEVIDQQHQEPTKSNDFVSLINEVHSQRLAARKQRIRVRTEEPFLESKKLLERILKPFYYRYFSQVEKKFCWVYTQDFISTYVTNEYMEKQAKRVDAFMKIVNELEKKK